MKKMKLTYVSLLADETIHGKYDAALDRISREFGDTHPIMIDGMPVRTGSEFDVFSPVDRSIHIGRFQNGGRPEILAAIDSAVTGFPEWSERDGDNRAEIIAKTAEILGEKRYLLAALITYESGKNRFEALAEVCEAVDMLNYYVKTWRNNREFRTPMDPEQPGAHCESVMRPHGVWAVISPFNFPLALAAGMAGAALLTGNTVVFKPASVTPLSGLNLYTAFRDSGVPGTALQFLTGPGKTFGDVIVRHEHIDALAFTGSRAAGMWLQRNFTAHQPYPKPVVSEMGSKNPVIVTDNADLEKAVEGIVKGAFGYSGQKCSATSRVYVHRDISSRFQEALIGAVGQLVTGDPRVRESFCGPVITGEACATFRDAVTACRNVGGTILAGGNVFSGGIYDGGWYVEPTVVTGLPHEHPLVSTELFVPFLILDTYATLDEAIGKANSTEFGLTAGIFSEDTTEIKKFFRDIRSGVCYANRRGGATTGAWPGSQSFGGWKGSGSTGKGVGGPYYLLSYLREQAQTMV